MAEGIFRAAVKNDTDVEVSSAGVAAAYGEQPSRHAIEVLRPLGVDISDFRSQPLTPELVQAATHIFVMTRGHQDAIKTYFPDALSKTYLLRKFDTAANGSLDVPDPIGLGFDAYLESRDTIKRSIPGIIQFLDQPTSR